MFNYALCQWIDSGIGLGPIHCVNVSFTLGTMLGMMQDATLTLSVNKVSQINWITWNNAKTFILLGTFAVLCGMEWILLRPG